MKNNTKAPLTSAEKANLWNFYMANTMSRCMFQHFLANVENKQIKKIIQDSDLLSQRITERVKSFFQEENIPLPAGFSEQDVNLTAPRLFSDSFYLLYIDMMYKLGLIFYSITLPNTTRLDIRQFITESMRDAANYSNQVTEVMLETGIYVRPPNIPTMNTQEMVERQSFFNGFFGDKRTLTGIEISQLFANIQFNTIKTVLLLAFSQVAESNEIRSYFIRGKHINIKQNTVFSNVLKQEDLPLTMPSQFNVTTTNIPPFSDKLMLFHISNLSSAKLRNFGDSIAVSPRHDLGSIYFRLMVETSNYAEDGGNLLIENNWMEKPPHNVDRNLLAKKKK
ncbi:DUF3231 family protein [Niallia circulans]|uniref:DUF3231 family protein n=1 Tax=Niallia circulans TaxID=1397 RepID=A0A553SNQ6_NIACI|nr:DUF3231 family protein [Niallia circulans]TRZ38586.1 DUF3231 family protein [Niallia circulans]